MRKWAKQRTHPGILLIFLGVLLGSSACGSGQPAPAEATVQASRAISLATQLAANLSATREVKSAQALETIQAIESLILQAKQWPVGIEERFDNNELDWPIGDGDDPLAIIHWEIRDRQYHWRAVANEPFVWWTIPDMDIYTNFFLAVDLEQVVAPPDGEAGLVFRLTESDYYLFEINASRQYSFFFHNQDGWESLRDWTDSESISVDGPNRLSVIAERENFHLFINNHHLASLTDSRLTSGSAGVLAGLSNSGDEGSWVFDNFVLQTQDITVP
jgi:hypothetical protein